MTVLRIVWENIYSSGINSFFIATTELDVIILYHRDIWWICYVQLKLYYSEAINWEMRGGSKLSALFTAVVAVTTHKYRVCDYYYFTTSKVIFLNCSIFKMGNLCSPRIKIK